MANMVARFAPSTVKAIKSFEDGLYVFKKEYPEFPLDLIRKYLEGKVKLPDDVEKQVNFLQEIRKNAIRYQMEYAKAEAESEGIKIPEKYLTGDALDVYFTENTYRFYDFYVYRFFSWYEPWEEAKFANDDFELFGI